MDASSWVDIYKSNLKNLPIWSNCECSCEKTKNRVVSVDEECGQITLNHDDKGPRTFTFDKVFGSSSRQESIYNDTAHQIVESVMEGYNGTMFAYGQTGSGKTWTMMGDDDGKYPGIIPLGLEDIFTQSEKLKGERVYQLKVSFMEIYNE